MISSEPWEFLKNIGPEGEMTENQNMLNSKFHSSQFLTFLNQILMTLIVSC